MAFWTSTMLVFLWSMWKYTFGVGIAFATIQSAAWGFTVSGVGAFTGIVLFTYSELWFEDKLRKRFKGKRVFTKTKRRLVRLKQMGGLPLIALLTPVLLNIPIGCLLATALERDRKKIIIYQSCSVVLWGLIYFGIKIIFNINPLEMFSETLNSLFSTGFEGRL